MIHRFPSHSMHNLHCRTLSWQTWNPLIVLLCCTSFAHAADPGTTIEVTAPPLHEVDVRAPAGFATVTYPDEHEEEAQTATDVLAESVGVQVRRFGGLGSFTTLSIRGSAANQIQIYLDGIPLSRARNETVNIANLPLDNLSRVEVYRGNAPVTFGTEGIGGVVNLVTREPTADPRTNTAASYGSFGNRRVVASHSRQIGRASILSFVTYTGSNGDFDFRERDTATGAPTEPAREMTRRNNAFDAGELFLKGTIPLAESLHLEIASDTFFKEQGVPGFGSPQALESSRTDLRQLEYFRLVGRDLLNGHVDARATAYSIYEPANFEDRLDELGQGVQDRHDHSVLFGARVDGSLYAHPNHTVGWFSEVAHEKFAGENRAVRFGSQPNAKRWRTSVAVEDQAQILGEWLLVVPSVRYQHVYDRGPTSTFGPRVEGYSSSHRDLWGAAIGAHSVLTRWLAVKGNLGRVQRAPNFTELFGNGGDVGSNASLREETALNRDLGLVMTPESWQFLRDTRLEYAYFNNDIEDLIVFVPNSQFTFVPQNVGGARVRGHEVSVQTKIAERLEIHLNYTHQEATNLTDSSVYFGRTLPGRPRDEVFTRWEALLGWANGYYELSFIADNFLDRANVLARIPQRDTHTVGVTVKPAKTMALNFEVQNLTDNQVSDVYGFPLPGRTFVGTITGTF